MKKNEKQVKVEGHILMAKQAIERASYFMDIANVFLIKARDECDDNLN